MIERFICKGAWLFRAWMSALVLGGSAWAWGATQGPGVDQYLKAARTTDRPRIDGKLDEAAWATAPVFSDFVQIFPKDDVPATERTEVRVLYDDNTLYVGVTCKATHPELILRSLSRRDQMPNSDFVQVAIDSTHDHRTAYRFAVNAGGVLQDTLLFNDVHSSDDWDAVWDAAASVQPDGWTAEFAIPFKILRFPLVDMQVWGFGVSRHIAFSHEDDATVRIPLNANGVVSRLGHLTGLDHLRPRQGPELTPYLAAREQIRPYLYDTGTQLLRPHPRFADPSADVGLDLRANLSSNLTLNATVNPDFGQVDADQLILNLSNVEAFFPEKRPFFLQGMDLFQQVGTENGIAPQMVFYSRRIGLATPIFAATKVTGTAGKGVEVGFLDALVMGPYSPRAYYGTYDDLNAVESDRHFGIHGQRPLHFGLNDELATTPQVPQNFFAGVVRDQINSNVTVGARASSAVPFTRPCTNGEADAGFPPTSCFGEGANVGAVDWDVRTDNGDWVFYGQVDGSERVGGPPTEVFRDGTPVDRGQTGFGTYMRAGKLGGEPFRFNLNFEYASPTLDLNRTGFLQRQNVVSTEAALHYIKPSGFGEVKYFDLLLRAGGRDTADGRWLDTGRWIRLNAEGLWPGFHFAGVEVGIEDNGYDTREIDRTGIAYQRPVGIYQVIYGNTDSTQPISVSGALSMGERFAEPHAPPVHGYTANLTLLVRPHARFETRLTGLVDYTPFGPRWIDAANDPVAAQTPPPGQYYFGRLQTHTTSVTLKQSVVLAPQLTLQMYAQLFSAVGQYGPFFTASSNGAPIHYSDLTPFSYTGNPDFHESTLNLNVVVRWEYRLGSTLFAVYSRSMSENPVSGGNVPSGSALPSHLFGGPATDTFLIKWAYWWNA